MPFDDIAELLTDALAAQGERRQWILEHWPHVVECAQIADTIDRGLAGPDLTGVLDTLTSASNRRLARAASDGQPWLVTLASRLTAADQDTPTADVAQLLGDIAGYRHRWDIMHPDPRHRRTHPRTGRRTDAVGARRRPSTRPGLLARAPCGPASAPRRIPTRC